MKPTVLNQILYSLTIAAGVTLPPLAKASDPPGMAGAQARFKAMDANGDGRISAAEHAAGARKMFIAMDANRDGQVSAAEMDAVHGRPDAADAEDRPLSSAEKIRTLDTNGDGLLSSQEHADGSARLFGKMDLNEDRVLTPDELAAGHAKLMHRGPE